MREWERKLRAKFSPSLKSVKLIWVKLSWCLHTYTHTHTHTHKHTHTRTHIHTYIYNTISNSLSLPLSKTHTHTYITQSLTLSLSLSLTHTQTYKKKQTEQKITHAFFASFVLILDWFFSDELRTAYKQFFSSFVFLQFRILHFENNFFVLHPLTDQRWCLVCVYTRCDEM